MGRQPQYPPEAYRGFRGYMPWVVGVGEAGHVRRALQLLRLQAGDCVCDAACGSGYNIGRLVRGVGREGLVIAVEDNPHLSARASDRIGRAGWENVQLLGALDPEQFRRRPVDGVIVAFNAPMFLGRSDLVETAWELLKPGGRIAVAGARCTTPAGRVAGPLIKLMLWWAGHPSDWHYWTVHEPWNRLQELASSNLRVETLLGFWYLVWAEKAEAA